MVLVAVQQRGNLVYEMLSAPMLVRMGTLSYGIYLWHYPVVRYFRADYPWPVVVVLTLLISTALAAISFYTLERWAMRHRDGVGHHKGGVGHRTVRGLPAHQAGKPPKTDKPSMVSALR